MAYKFENANLVSTLTGRTIKSIEIAESWKTNDIDSLCLVLDNGDRVNLNASTESGCENCDSDGSSQTTIDFYINKNKNSS